MFGREVLKRRKSQSAMEYLMTYGWAILIIAIVLVALFSLGVFNSSNFSPRAQPGSCEVLKNSAQTSLVGQCNGMLPQYVLSVPSDSAFNSAVTTNLNLNGSTSMTITVWFNPKLEQAVGAGYAVGSGSWCPDGITIYYTGSTRYIGVDTTMYPLDAADSCNSNFIQTPTIENPNQWYFVAAVYNGTGTALYVNGQFMTSITPANSINKAWYSAPFEIGNFGCSTCTNHPFNGTISNVQVYNTTLSNSSIKALYKEGIGGAPINIDNLIGWWPLNGNANDYSGNNNNGAAGNVTYTSAWTFGYSAP
jgi:hypothetical protein